MVSDDRCAALPFTPTWVPRGWSFELQVGDGGQLGIPLEEQSPQAYGHYTNGRGRFISVYRRGEYYTLPPGADKVELFPAHRPARIGAVHEGFAAEFRVGGCHYSLIDFGLWEPKFRRFLDGLLLVRGRGAEDAFALWPEQSPRAAVAPCRREEERRRDPAQVVSAFASEVLGISSPETSELDDGRFLVLDDSVKAALVSANEIAYRCWSVSHVAPAVRWRPLGNYTWSGDSLQVLVDDPTKHGAVEATLRIFPLKNDPESVTYVSPFPRFFRLDVGRKPVLPSAYVIVFRDEAGHVVGAYGHALPTYQTAAG